MCSNSSPQLIICLTFFPYRNDLYNEKFEKLDQFYIKFYWTNVREQYQDVHR